MKNSEASAQSTSFYRIGGLSGTSPLSFIARHFDRALIVFPSQYPISLEDSQRALKFFLDLESKQASSYKFPEIASIYSNVSADPEVAFERIKTQYSLAKNSSKNLFVLSNSIALSQKALHPKELLSSVFEIKKGDWIDRDEFVSQLLRLGYRRDELAEDQGFMSIRGHLVDVFPMGEENPFRIEFFGDEIVSIRSFDPETQRSLNDIEKILLLPLRELMRSSKNHESARARLKEIGDAKRIDRETRDKILFQLENNKELFEYRHLLPAFAERELVSPLEYLPKDIPIILVDYEKIKKELDESLRTEEEEYQEFQNLAYPVDKLRSSVSGILSEESHRIWSQIHPQATNYQSFGFEDLRHRLSRAKSFSPLRQIISESREANCKTLIVFRNERKLQSLKESLSDISNEVFWKISDSFPGFYSKTLGLSIITERDIFGPTRKRAGLKGSQISAARFLREFSDLQSGDFIVHEDHGIGRYRGLIKLRVGKVESEFLFIEYADQDKLYLPIYRVNKISRYVKGEGYAEPKLDRLGSQSFIKRKSKAKKDIFQIAHELIQVAAERKLHKIDRPKIDENAFADFSHRFGFELTPDQDSAIRDVIDDLQKNYPMDRLICGDVGFGKTEVALRAAMYRLLQGVQVAVLAPTTLLVEQHFRNFKKRFKDTGFRVERLSRFVSKSETKKILNDLTQGQIDLVIGTHRLLQRDIQFKNLGLLIIDEEQRFGVKHKEKIKKLRTNIDVLTLSATPIPRTLQMSIVGIRELSLIVTPPETREAVQTYVGAFDEKLIREKVAKEMERNGQVFFVHNRVKSIYGLKDQLQKILPDIKIAVAHGQMKEDELENVMLDFMERKYDLLLTTSIIENGIDIPNANTLFVDHAEQFGLSDLYQLRGRVGRSDRKAYSYFLIREDTVLTADASKRLQVLQSCTELGSGFRVATHDLEIRGSGNLLGEAQSGIIAEIGLELYNQMLHETLEDIRSGKQPKLELPEIRPGFSAFIPDSYIPDPSIRISTYRRLNQIQELTQLTSFEDELLDRFGLYPKEVEVLCAIAGLRIHAAKIRAKEMDINPGKLILDFGPDTPLDPLKVIKHFGKKLYFDPKGRLIYSFDSALENSELIRGTKWQYPEFYDLHQSKELLLELLRISEPASSNES